MTEADVKRITGRIKRVEQAKALAAAGKLEEAIQVLERAREAYEGEPRMLKNVDWLLDKYRAQQGS